MREKDRADAMFTLDELARTIDQRAGASAETSYTRSLLDKGAAHCARKFGEEAIELAIAAAALDESAVRAEAADVLYHLLVVLRARGVALSSVMDELEQAISAEAVTRKRRLAQVESAGEETRRARGFASERVLMNRVAGSIARVPIPPLHPRRMGATARRHPAHAHDRRSAQAAVDARSDLARRGRRHLSAAVAAARALCRGDAGAVQGDAALPWRDRRQSPLHHRHRRLGRGRQVDDGARVAGAADPLAEHAQGAARHHRRLPAPERRTDPAGHHGPQGLSRELRRDGACSAFFPRSRRDSTMSPLRSIRISPTTS